MRELSALTGLFFACSGAVVPFGLWVRVTAKPGKKEEEVAEFLTGSRAVVEEEPDTVEWFAVRLDRSTFAVFDAFPDDSGRQAQLAGGVGQARPGVVQRTARSREH